MGANVRIRSKKTGEVYGAWIVQPEDMANRMPYIDSELVSIQAEDPSMGWSLEFKGESTGWHEDRR